MNGGPNVLVLIVRPDGREFMIVGGTEPVFVDLGDGEGERIFMPVDGGPVRNNVKGAVFAVKDLEAGLFDGAAFRVYIMEAGRPRLVNEDVLGDVSLGLDVLGMMMQ